MKYAFLALPLIIISAIGILPILSPSKWAEEFGDRTSWRRLALLAVSLGNIVGVGIFIATAHFNDTLWSLALALSAGLLTVCFNYSVFTDVKLHKVDARILNYSTVITFIINLILVIVHKNYEVGITCGSLLLLCLLAYLFIQSLGAADIFAGALVSVSVVPIAGYFGFMWAAIGVCLLGVAAALGMGMVQRTMKASIPLAPLILFPFLVVVILSPYIAFSPVRIG
jgi:hypothetical protein